MNLTANQASTQVLQKGYQFLLYMWYMSCYSSYKRGDESWRGKNIINISEQEFVNTLCLHDRLFKYLEIKILAM
jgi:hypothetical protein